MKKKITCALALLLVFLTTAQAQQYDTIRLMHYNLTYYNFNTNTCTTNNNSATTKDGLLKTITKHVAPDIFTVNEMGANAITPQRIIVNVLNTDGVNYYQQAAFTNGTQANGNNSNIVNMLFFNTNKLALKKQSVIQTSVRVTDVYQLYHKNSVNSDTVFLNVVVTHLKAGQTAADSSTRAAQTQTIMNWLNTNITASKQNIILAGDLNVYTSNEQCYQNLITHPNTRIRFRDPINKAGNWNENSSFALYHTQSTRTTSNGCLSGGGMDDRFDHVLANQSVMNDSASIQILTNTYKALGQDGLRFNQSINNPTNNSVPTNVANALFNMSDHLPVVVDFKFTLNVPNSLAQKQYAPTFDIHFTNPVQNYIQGYYNSQKNNPLDVAIFDISGKILHTTQLRQSGSFEIAVPHLAKGIYIMRVNDDSKYGQTYKIVKN
jgi:endonuclease/exonuclease/phosphatase family metal-dependent hydrolase